MSNSVQKNPGPPMCGPIIINDMSNLRESVKARLQEEKISFLLVQFVDLSGAAKVKMCPVEALDALVDEGAGFAGAAIGGFAQGPNSPDMMARVDLNTYTPLPWYPGMVRFVGDLYVEGKPYPYCPRLNLQRLLKEASDKFGFFLNVGLEPEHFLVTRNPDGSIEPWDPADVDQLAKPCYDFKGISSAFGYLQEIVSYCNQLGWGAYQADHEDANGQYEVNFQYADALATADRYTFFKMMTSQVAPKYGAVATHMAKPFADRTGSGAHMHYHVADSSGKNLLHENEAYVPLVRRALELWEELEKAGGTQLFYRTGSLDIGLPKSAIVTRSLNACRRWSIPHTQFTAVELQRRYPVLRPYDEMVGIFQPGSGFVLAEGSITAHVNGACAHGAEIHGCEKAVRWQANQTGYVIETAHDRYEAGQIVFTVGAWAAKVLGSAVRVRPERAVLGWFQPTTNAALFGVGSLPVWIIDSPDGGHFYGLPIFGIPGFKLGRLSVNLDEVDPDLPLREPDSRDEEDLRQFLEKHFPDANGSVLSMQTALFEHSPDRHFIIDELPDFPGAWIIAGLSGHGFKYASALGELAKDLVVQRKGGYDLSAFRLDRFG